MTCSRRQTAKGTVARSLPFVLSVLSLSAPSRSPPGPYGISFGLTRQTRDLSHYIFLYRNKHASLSRPFISREDEWRNGRRRRRRYEDDSNDRNRSLVKYQRTITLKPYWDNFRNQFPLSWLFINTQVNILNNKIGKFIKIIKQIISTTRRLKELYNGLLKDI